MAALTETRKLRLSDFFGVPGDDALGPTPRPAPIPDLPNLQRRVLIDIVNWSPTTSPEVAQSIGSIDNSVQITARILEGLGLITRTRKSNNQPWLLCPTEEGRRVARALELREVV